MADNCFVTGAPSMISPPPVTKHLQVNCQARRADQQPTDHPLVLMCSNKTALLGDGVFFGNRCKARRHSFSDSHSTSKWTDRTLCVDRLCKRLNAIGRVVNADIPTVFYFTRNFWFTSLPRMETVNLFAIDEVAFGDGLEWNSSTSRQQALAHQQFRSLAVKRFEIRTSDMRGKRVTTIPQVLVGFIWVVTSEQAKVFPLERCDRFARRLERRPSNCPGCVDRLARLSELPSLNRITCSEVKIQLNPGCVSCPKFKLRHGQGCTQLNIVKNLANRRQPRRQRKTTTRRIVINALL
ncbi:hypothetical protein CSKR_110599 [Clonorchis sinensis]|uniref:Uncharacterized protein n=2 Tax=Clonorchis sinensis TaxID=79923 RepID=A0A8T1LYY7_CLOSI|nr:hypothetical protein CSKR_110599 [Clonorchis sinensis]GAA53560.1 hypothetical protein CLF_110496 [Clonorchis sinensis]